MIPTPYNIFWIPGTLRRRPWRWWRRKFPLNLGCMCLDTWDTTIVISTVSSNSFIMISPVISPDHKGKYKKTREILGVGVGGSYPSVLRASLSGISLSMAEWLETILGGSSPPNLTNPHNVLPHMKPPPFQTCHQDWQQHNIHYHPDIRGFWRLGYLLTWHDKRNYHPEFLMDIQAISWGWSHRW